MNMALTSSSVSYVYVIRGKNNVFHLAKMMMHPPLFSRTLLIPQAPAFCLYRSYAGLLGASCTE